DILRRDSGRLYLLLVRQAADLGLESALCFDARGGLLARGGKPVPGASALTGRFRKSSPPGYPPEGAGRGSARPEPRFSMPPRHSCSVSGQSRFSGGGARERRAESADPIVQ